MDEHQDFLEINLDEPLCIKALFVNQVVGYSVDGQSSKRVYLQFPDDITPMCNHRVDGDKQFVGDFLIRHPLDEAYDDNSI